MLALSLMNFEKLAVNLVIALNDVFNIAMGLNRSLMRDKKSRRR